MLFYEKNLNEMERRKAQNIELKHVDATEFNVPDDVNLIYFFNPFGGEILRKVVDNISTSLRTHPRKLYVIFFNNDHFDNIVGG